MRPDGKPDAWSRTMRRAGVAALALCAVLGATVLAARHATAAPLSVLDTVRQRGELVCGVGDDVIGFSELDRTNRWRGLDVEYCRAVAAAVLGDKERVVFRMVPTSTRFAALKAGDIDILTRGAGWTLSRDVGEGVRFVAALFHDAVRLMVRRADGLTSALELSSANVCVLAGSEAAAYVSRFFTSRGMRYHPIAGATWSELVKAYSERRCLALAGEMTVLAKERARLAAGGEHILLPERLSHAPIGPVVRGGDEQWFDITRWVLFALIGGEELGVSAGNAATMVRGPDPAVRLMLGAEGNLGARLGLAGNWAYNVLRQVGNYGEIYERAVGGSSELKLPRGQNALARDGGLMWSPPFR